MIASLSAIKVSFCWSLRKTAFQLGSVRNVDPSSPWAAGVRPDETACANENAGPSAEAALVNNAARTKSRRLIRGDGECGFASAGVASWLRNFMARNDNA